MSNLERVAVDASAILPAIISGAALKAYSVVGRPRFITTQYNINEVKHYIPNLAERFASPNSSAYKGWISKLEANLKGLPLEICTKEDYQSSWEQARREVEHRGGTKDVHLAAVALWSNADLIWTHDPSDFQDCSIPCIDTPELLSLLGLTHPKKKR